MIRSFSKNTAEKVIAIEPIIESEFDAWIHKQNQHTKNWIAATNYHPTSGAVSLLGQAEGHLDRVLVGMRDANDFWAFGQLSSYLPKGTYRIESKLTADQLYRASLAWGLGAYQFITYKQIEPYQAMLILSDEVNQSELEHLISSIYMVRDLINTPAEDMGPKQLAGVAVQVAKDWGANVHQIIGEDLLKESYPAIHAVGRASVNAPRLIDLRWGDEAHPKLTLVGKGVCFDTGGLNIKPTPNMTLMKKDMGGAAVVLGLARMIMALKLPVRLRVLIGAAENSISGNAIRPGDVIPTRKGITVEVNNTDAEGRLVLCDAITEAVAENPDLLIDFATLTGAARAALGTDVPVFFSSNDKLADDLMSHGKRVAELVWRLPIYMPYRKLLNSPIADIANAGTSPYAGAILAAIYLKEFVPDHINWVHFDIMAWNVCLLPGRPEGGEAQGLRAVLSYLRERFV